MTNFENAVKNINDLISKNVHMTLARDIVILESQLTEDECDKLEKMYPGY